MSEKTPLDATWLSKRQHSGPITEWNSGNVHRQLLRLVALVMAGEFFLTE